MTTVEKIHHEVDTAQERLLESALKTLSEIRDEKTTYIEGKAERLKKLGFSSSPLVIKNEKQKETRERLKKSTQKKADYILYYKRKYPFHKFLTEEELERICKKYSLIYAPVSNYVKDIPEKNLCEIEDMKEIEQEDVPEERFHLIGKKEFQVFMGRIGYPDCKITKKELNKEVSKVYGSCPINWDDPTKETTGLFVLGRRFPNSHHFFDKCEVENRTGLFIAAPKSHFNLVGLKKNKKGFFKIFESEAPDPIIYQYVNGGLLVKTKWGDEASDPLVVNEINN